MVNGITLFLHHNSLLRYCQFPYTRNPKRAIEKIFEEGLTKIQTIIAKSKGDKKKVNEMDNDSKPDSNPLFEGRGPRKKPKNFKIEPCSN